MSVTDDRVETMTRSGRIVEEYAPYSAKAARALERDLKTSLDCPVDFGAQAKAMFATDASNYRQVPIGVVTPRTREDVIETVRLCCKHDAPIVARGGGTSLAGQTCNVAVVIDFSRFLNHVLELDPEGRTARIEPGCILDTLRNAAERHHLTFGPDPATHDHNTLGGMIGNNSCGVHSVMSGRTSDNVERLTIVTYDGEVMEVGPTAEAHLRSIVESGGRRGEIYARLISLRDRFGPDIEARYPRIPRRVSGFENLDQLLPGRGFNVAKALVGTEGSCVLVLDAVVKLVPSPPCRALALLGFADVFVAADAVPSILKHNPLACEGFDDLLVSAERKSHLGESGLDRLPAGRGWLIVETGGDTPGEARRKAEVVAGAVSTDVAANIVADAEGQQAIWAAREASLGATAEVPGQPRTWEGWEDSAVSPAKLGNYLRDLKALFHQHGYEAAVYGHFGGGLVHCRVNFNFANQAGVTEFRKFTREAAELVTRYGGSLSGEHGDGQARADMLEQMYGARLVECFREFKAIWDPGNRMNPGKAIEAFPRDSNLRLGPAYHPKPLESAFRFPADDGSFAQATLRCIGIGACRRRDPKEGVMCPSYLGTGEEKHSTRGRARLLNEMVRGSLLRDGWDSAEVEDALSLCLACKGCKSDCPVSVDMATYKAEFRAHHYRDRPRPRSARYMPFVHNWAHRAEAMPWLANFIAGAPGLSNLAKWLGGVDQRAHLPRFARRSFRHQFRRRDAGRHSQKVMLWPDTFNNHFRPQTAMAAARLLEAAGCEVVLPDRPLCCGRPLYDWGYLDEAKQLWVENFATLQEEIAGGIPIIGLEPACVSAFKDELPNLFAGREEAMKLSRQVIYFADWIVENLARLPPLRKGGRAIVQAHCHHHAIIGFDAELMLLDRLDIAAERPPQGCCGMAGGFGFAKETHELAGAIGERVLLPAIRNASRETLIIADGFSCREQIEQRTGRKTLHIAELLEQRMLGFRPPEMKPSFGPETQKRHC